MNSLKQIKLKELKEYLSNFHHFGSLNDQEKQNYLEKIIDMPIDQQELVYHWLLYEEEKEKERVLSNLKQQVNLLGKEVQRIEKENEEHTQKSLDAMEEMELENKLTQ